MPDTNLYAYKIGNKLYLNITNRCTNNCTFCIRNFADGVRGYNLLLSKEPTAAKIIKIIENPAEYEEVVFCGYGEPLIRLKEVIKISQFIKSKNGTVRVDTNGHANLIHKTSVPPLLKGIVDRISISLNASSKEEYNKICRPLEPDKAYPSLIEFILQCQENINNVLLTVVSGAGIDINQAIETAKKLNLPLRIR